MHTGDPEACSKIMIDATTNHWAHLCVPWGPSPSQWGPAFPPQHSASLPLYLTLWMLVPPGVSNSTLHFDLGPLPHTIWHIPSALMSWELGSLNNNLNPLNMDKMRWDDSGHCEGGHAHLSNQMDLFSSTLTGRGQRAQALSWPGQAHTLTSLLSHCVTLTGLFKISVPQFPQL